MEAILFSPPVIFILFFVLFAISAKLFTKYSNQAKTGEHTLDPYACGQRDVEHYVNPDYSQYYSYAFVFTIVHILILVVATAPKGVSILPVAYVLSGIFAIVIAFRR